MDLEIDNSVAFSKSYLPVKELELILDGILKDEIESYSWMTLDINDFIGSRKGFKDVKVTHIGKLYNDSPRIVAVSPNFLNTTFSDDFLIINSR